MSDDNKKGPESAETPSKGQQIANLRATHLDASLRALQSLVRCHTELDACLHNKHEDLVLSAQRLSVVLASYGAIKDLLSRMEVFAQDNIFYLLQEELDKKQALLTKNASSEINIFTKDIGKC